MRIVDRKRVRQFVSRSKNPSLQGTVAMPKIWHVAAANSPLDVQVNNSDLPFDISAYATGNDPLGRGGSGPRTASDSSKSFSLGCAQALEALSDHAVR